MRTTKKDISNTTINEESHKKTKSYEQTAESERVQSALLNSTPVVFFTADVPKDKSNEEGKQYYCRIKLIESYEIQRLAFNDNDYAVLNT